MTNYDNYVNLLLRPDLIQEIDRELATRSLRAFIQQAWPVLQPATPFVPGWHIDALCEHLEAITYGQIRNLVINIPPRHMKSLAVSVFWPCWEWARWPERRWLFASYAESLSLRDSRHCRTVVQSPWYRCNWGDVFVLTEDQNEKRRFDNDKTGYRIASSVGGANTGEGGDRIVCDDPHNVKEAESDAARKGVCDWYDQVMSTRVNDPKTAARVIIMQRVHEADLSGHVLAQGGYEHLCLPAEYEGSKRTTVIGWSDPRTELGELLWPERFGHAEIAELKLRLGSYGAAGQLQQRPSPAEGGILKRHWWRRYQSNEHPLRLDVMIQSWDLAFKDTKKLILCGRAGMGTSGWIHCLGGPGPGQDDVSGNATGVSGTEREISRLPSQAGRGQSQRTGADPDTAKGDSRHHCGRAGWQQGGPRTRRFLANRSRQRGPTPV